MIKFASAEMLQEHYERVHTENDAQTSGAQVSDLFEQF
jgi:hypothetical protein